jgi:hypothetical protein
MVGHAIEQGDDPIGIQVQIGRFLPKPVGTGLVGLLELGLGQLAGEEKQQLTLLQGGKAQGLSFSSPWMPRPWWCLFHRYASGTRWISPHFGNGQGAPPGFRMKCIGCCRSSPWLVGRGGAPTSQEDLPS